MLLLEWNNEDIRDYNHPRKLSYAQILQQSVVDDICSVASRDPLPIARGNRNLVSRTAKNRGVDIPRTGISTVGWADDNFTSLGCHCVPCAVDGAYID